ncbi:MAG: hypothetical protein WC413_01070 [Candidatus Nanoarchaeia archaeon]
MSRVKNLLAGLGLTALSLISTNCGNGNSVETTKSINIPNIEQTQPNQDCTYDNNFPKNLELKVSNDKYTYNFPENIKIKNKLAYLQNCNQFVSYNGNKFTINPLNTCEDAIVFETEDTKNNCNQTYALKLKINEPDCAEVDLPEEIEMKIGESYNKTIPGDIPITIEDNKFVELDGRTIKIIKPWHIYDKDINIHSTEKITPLYNCEKDKKINIKINPITGKDGTIYSYYRPINSTNILVCDQTASTPCPFEPNEFASLDVPYTLFKEAIKKLEEITTTNVFDEYAPFKIHLNASPDDSVSSTIVKKEDWNKVKAGGFIGGEHVYAFQYDWATNVDWPIFCLNLENPTQEPLEPTETCQCAGNAKTEKNVCKSILNWNKGTYFRNPETDINPWFIHELVHERDPSPRVLRKGSDPYYTDLYLPENTANALETITSGVVQGWIAGKPYFITKEINSFCDLPLGTDYTYFRAMCILTDHAFDVETMPKYFEYLWKAYEKRLEKSKNQLTWPEDVKCATDYATELDTYDWFCKFSNCSNDKMNYNYVPSEFCGDLSHIDE